MRKPKMGKLPKKPKLTASPEQKKKYLSKVASIKKDYNKKMSEYKNLWP
ncbi:hypothetical protein [Salmonirosea aquatica]